MTSKQRVYERLKGREVDKIPNLNIVMGLAARCAGVSYREYVQDYKLLVKGNIICAERFGIDAVSAISDPMREASAYGAHLTFPENGVPYSETPLLEEGIDISRVRKFAALDCERTLDRIRAVELFRREVGDEYPIIGWVEGVLAETADLRGVSNLMYDLADEEESLGELMEIILECQCKFALEQIKAGADIIGIGNAVASLVGPDLYEEYAFEHDKRLVDFIHENGALVKLHICGNITGILPQLMNVAPDILDVDWMVDFPAAVKMFEGTGIAINGNVDPVEVLLRGSAAFVEEKTQECIVAASANTFIAAGCEVPALTPEENLVHMDRLLMR